MSTHIVCSCNNDDCRVNGCLIMRQRNEAGGFYAVDSADFGRSTRLGRSKKTRALTDEQKAKFVNNIIECGTEFVVPLLSVVESIEQAVLQSPVVQGLRDALQEVVDAADGEGWKVLDATFEKQRAALAAIKSPWAKS